MKKRTMILGGLIAAVAITGYSVAGTYAKYTTAVNTNDNKALVARWNVALNDTTTVDLSKATVYPGANGSATFTLNITSDVDYTVSVTESANATNDATIAAEEADKTTLTGFLTKDGNNYSPLKFSISVAGTEVNDNITYEDLATTLATILTNKANAGQEITIEWNWLYENNADANKTVTFDKYDTLIGNKAYNANKNGDVTANTVALVLGFDITVTQKNA